jgi:hypothetical protein
LLEVKHKLANNFRNLNNVFSNVFGCLLLSHGIVRTEQEPPFLKELLSFWNSTTWRPNNLVNLNMLSNEQKVSYLAISTHFLTRDFFTLSSLTHKVNRLELFCFIDMEIFLLFFIGLLENLFLLLMHLLWPSTRYRTLQFKQSQWKIGSLWISLPSYYI